MIYNNGINQTIVNRLKHSSVKYFAVGIVAFAIDYLVLLFLYYVLNINLELATAIGFIVGFCISFTANRQWVFGNVDQRKNLNRQVIEYSLLVAFNFGFTVIAVSFLNNHGITPSIGKLLVMGVVMCWNYVLFRWVIFEEKTR